MRSVLALALCALVFLVAMRASARVAMTASDARPAQRAALNVVAVGKGALLPATTLPGGDETLDDVILLGDLILSIPERPSGLRVAALTPELEFAEHRVFDLAGNAEHVEDLLWICAHKPLRSVLVLVSYGSIRPRVGVTDGYEAELTQLFRTLGAEANPVVPGNASWAMITVKLERGWVKLAEAYGTGQGVALAYTIDGDLDAYAEHRGEFVMSDATIDAPILLDVEVACAETSDKVRRVRGAKVGNVARDAIDARTLWIRDGEDQPSTVLWRGIALREGAVFESGIGLRDGSWERSNGVTFALRVNGDVVRERTLTPDDPPADWIEWSVDLSAFVDRTIDLELRVDPLGNATDDRAFWSNPRIVFPKGAE